MTVSKKPLFVLTIEGDTHVPHVQRHLTSPLISVDPSLDAKSSLSYSTTKDGLSVIYNGQELPQPKSIWLRRPRMAEYEEIPVAKRNFAYSKSAIDMHWTTLYSLFQNALWVSDYYAIQRAGRKPFQIEAARRLGFQVPETLFTSDPLAARQFLKKHKKCIVKPLAYRSMLTEGGDPKPFLTRKIHDGQDIDFSRLYLAPAIFQQAIDVDVELRVTVIGEKVFTGAITANGLDADSPYSDYKLAYLKQGASVAVAPYDLPDEIADKCIAHAKMLNLNCCGIDILKDKKGTYWFLENNPNGQWAFVESEAGLPIGKALAELLEKGKIK